MSHTHTHTHITFMCHFTTAKHVILYRINADRETVVQYLETVSCIFTITLSAWIMFVFVCFIFWMKTIGHHLATLKCSHNEIFFFFLFFVRYWNFVPNSQAVETVIITNFMWNAVRFIAPISYERPQTNHLIYWVMICFCCTFN